MVTEEYKSLDSVLVTLLKYLKKIKTLSNKIMNWPFNKLSNPLTNYLILKKLNKNWTKLPYKVVFNPLQEEVKLLILSDVQEMLFLWFKIQFMLLMPETQEQHLAEMEKLSNFQKTINQMNLNKKKELQQLELKFKKAELMAI